MVAGQNGLRGVSALLLVAMVQRQDLDNVPTQNQSMVEATV